MIQQSSIMSREQSLKKICIEPWRIMWIIFQFWSVPRFRGHTRYAYNMILVGLHCFYFSVKLRTILEYNTYYYMPLNMRAREGVIS